MQSFFTPENSASSILKVFSGFSLILILSWFVTQRECYLPLNFLDVKEIPCCWILEEMSEGKKTRTRDNTRVISIVKIIELRKDGFNKYQTIIIYVTFLLSTVPKPISDFLGSFSPSSRPIKTFTASENIPRSVRIRTCWSETTSSHWTLSNTFSEMTTVSSFEGVISWPGPGSSNNQDNTVHRMNLSLMENTIG